MFIFVLSLFIKAKWWWRGGGSQQAKTVKWIQYFHVHLLKFSLCFSHMIYYFTSYIEFLVEIYVLRGTEEKV